MISIRRENWKRADKLRALAQGISDTSIKRVVSVVGVGKDTVAHNGFHDVAGRSLHDNITGEIRRQSPCLTQNFFEFGKLSVVGHDAHNQQ